MALYECAECGSVVETKSKKWPKCEKTGRCRKSLMALIISWGKGGVPIYSKSPSKACSQ